jgi:hypothetical protein
MNHPVRRRFWFEIAVALIIGGLAVLTIVWPSWFEGLTGTDLDHRDGSLESLITLIFATASVGSAVIARREWRRYRLSPSS